MVLEECRQLLCGGDDREEEGRWEDKKVRRSEGQNLRRLEDRKADGKRGRR